MSNHVIKTAQTEIKTDKNGKKYRGILFTEVVMMSTPFGQMQKPAEQSVSRQINRYEESYLNNKPELGYTAPIFNPKNPANGGIFEGSIERRQVVPYDIPGTDGAIREANHYTTVVFGDTNSPDYESLVEATFKNQGHPVLTAAVVKAKENPVAEGKAF